jgi:recombination DNA repair RAD52 pathway protein
VQNYDFKKDIMKENEQLALITADDLSLVENSAFNEFQLRSLLQRTPKEYIKQRPAKGGGTWEYVSGGYVKKLLNLMFGFDWSFEILEQSVQFGEVIVKGKLTCNSNGKTIVKMQFGNKDVIYKKSPDKDGNLVPLSIGNDMKAAATDALKKCASEIGIAADIYNKEEFKAVKVITSKQVTKDSLELLFSSYSEFIEPSEAIEIERIIKTNETRSFAKVYKVLKQIEANHE